MKIVGIITEYNPFHNGHKYHIEEAKRITGADYCIAVMSGNFVQRGAPAIIDKYNRTRMALNNGVDLVLELPTCFATASAEYFALGAVSLLNKLGVVDYLCFGSEWGDIELLKVAANLIAEEADCYKELLISYIKEGLTYPAARAKAMEGYLNSHNNTYDRDAINQLLSEPNNILGIEYIKAINRISSDIIPVTIQRKSAHYHDRYEEKNSQLSPITSATALRDLIETSLNADDLIKAKESIPEDVYQFLRLNYKVSYPINEEDFNQILIYKLLSESNESLTRYLDISRDMADRIMNILDYKSSYLNLIQNIKTKNLTLTRINRALIHVLLNITKDIFQNNLANGYVPYARVLGLRKTSSHIIREIDKQGNIPVIRKVSKAIKQLDDNSITMLQEDIFAAHIYNQAVYHKFKTPIPNEYQHEIVII
ncbi:MAG: nucleotidyltransferase [Clostridiales bacterium]|nr:nucleotidyltransferase [Clostridiales bacterium]